MYLAAMVVRALLKYRFLCCLLFISGMIAGCQTAPFVTPDHPGYLDSIVGKNKYQASDSTGYMKTVDSAYLALHDPGPGDLWTKYKYKYYFYHLNLRDFKTAMLYTDSMLYSIREHDNEQAYIEMFARTLFNKGDTYLEESKYPESFNWYYKAREVILKKNDPCINSEYTSRLASVTYRQERYADAANYFKLAIADFENCHEVSWKKFSEMQGTLDNIGIAYIRARIYDSADAYFNRALNYIRDNEHLFPTYSDDVSIARAVIYGNLAEVAIQRKDPDTAEKLLIESIGINIQPGHPDEDAALSIVKLAKIYISQGRINDADKELTRLVALAKTFVNPEIDRDIFLLRSMIAGKRGDDKIAYRSLERYHQLLDSVNAKRGPMISTDMQLAIDHLNGQYQLEMLSKANQKKSDYLWLTVLISIMALAIIVLIWFNYRRYKQNVITLVGLNATVNSKNQALLQTLAALESSHNNNTRLLKVVAHDLRGPLGAITSIAELAADGMVPGEKFQEIMAIIYRSGTKALTLANHLLEDMQTIGQLIDPEPLNIEEKILSCVELYEHRIKEKQQTVIMETVPAFVNGERGKLWRAFSNLISNAVKFSRIGGEIRITMRIEGDKLVTAIHDNGIGIPDDLKDRIFEPTEATTRPGTIGERSFGLGLSIARNIITQHNGELWFESSYTMGTTFYVSLPLLHDGGNRAS